MDTGDISGSFMRRFSSHLTNSHRSSTFGWFLRFGPDVASMVSGRTNVRNQINFLRRISTASNSYLSSDILH